MDDFLSQRLAAYEATIAAFDVGDREALRESLCPDVYEVFCQTIKTREAQRQTAETVFSQIETPEIVGGLIDEAHMKVSLRFVCEYFRLYRNAAGNLLNETPARRRSVDIWTFERALSSSESAWRVAAIEGEIQ